jgi:hypothetical protein
LVLKTEVAWSLACETFVLPIIGLEVMSHVDLGHVIFGWVSNSFVCLIERGTSRGMPMMLGCQGRAHTGA